MKKLIFLLVLLVLFFSLVSTGCKKEASTEGLKISNLVFCSQIRGDRDYSERTDRTFSLDKPTYVYAEISNLTSKSTGGKVEYWLLLEVQVKDPNGNSIIERQKIIDQKV